MYSPVLNRFQSRDPLPLEGEPDILYGDKWVNRNIVARTNLYAYAENNPIRYINPPGLNPIQVFHDEANRRRGHGPWDESAQHCWAAAYIGLLGGLGFLPAYIEDFAEIVEPSDDTLRDIAAQHFGAGAADTIYHLARNPLCRALLASNAAKIADKICSTWP